MQMQLQTAICQTGLLQHAYYKYLLWNGKSYFLITADSLEDPILEIETEFGKKFRDGVATNSISEEMVEYYYDSLCFDFNNVYGLVEKFNNFDQFLETYYKTKIKNIQQFG